MLIREGIPKDYTPVCLRRTLQESKACIETLVMFIHSIIQKKGPLESVLTELVSWITSVKDETNADSKFSRLIMDLVCLYGSQMSPAHIDSIVKVVTVNQTLLKKPIENMLRKLKK